MPEAQHTHEAVLVAALLRLLDPKPGQVIADGTVGLGGHAAVLVPRILPGGRYFGLDLDEAMLQVARERLQTFAGETLHLKRGNFADLPTVLDEAGAGRADHLLLDLGVNSAQLADPARGFSFERDGPLDMCFDRNQREKAIDLVNGLPERELADLFYEFGQEGMSRKIAKRICRARHAARITTTKQLAQVVVSAFAATGKPQRGRLHPATRVFQALRVAVNRELDNLRTFLENVRACLAPGGKLAIISFHSLEDGMVKRFVRAARADGWFEELTRRPVIADPKERKANPRSRSAKLRVAQRID